MRFTVVITLAAMALVSGMAAGISADLPAARHGIVGAWDIFDDECRSGYLEYRADGRFGQVYRRDQESWIVDPIWGHGNYRAQGDILITGEQKYDGSIRIETKQRLSFPDHDRMEVDYLEMVWVDDITNSVKAVESFTESWSRCPVGALDDIAPVAAFVDHDPALVVGRWGWLRGCATGYVEYTRDGRIWLVERERGGEDGHEAEFEYGFYEIKDRLLFEVYAYGNGIWKSESNFAFDDRGRMFFSDSMNATWSDQSGVTEDSEPFFEVLFNCADDETPIAGAASGDQQLTAGPARAEASTLDAMLFDSDVARVSRIIAEFKSRCAFERGQPEAAAECVDYAWSTLDISGDGLLSLSEIARGLRMFAKWSAHEQARAYKAPLDSATKLGIHTLGILFSPLGAKPLLDSYDYDDDGRLSREELFADTNFADVLALSQRPLADAIDMEIILEKLQQIMRMTMQ